MSFTTEGRLIGLMYRRRFKVNGNKLKGYNHFAELTLIKNIYDTFYVHKNSVIASCGSSMKIKRPIRIYEFY